MTSTSASQQILVLDAIISVGVQSPGEQLDGYVIALCELVSTSNFESLSATD